MTRALPGRLVALEGIDGSGKSTQAPLLAASLGALHTFEPGATAIGRELRRLLVSVRSSGGDGGGEGTPSPRTEALLVAADRAAHVAEIVRPALEAGRWVVTDRFSGSTLAYQGYGRGLDLSELTALSQWAAGEVVADLSILLDVPLALARSRVMALHPDRMDQLEDAFFGRVRDGYLALAAADPTHWSVVDATGDPARVAQVLYALVVDRLGTPL